MLIQAVYFTPLALIGTQDVSIDLSWSLALPYQLQHFHLSGRDFQFTYGPLAQLIGLPALALTHRTALEAGPMMYLSYWIVNILLVALILLCIPQVRAWSTLFILILIDLFQIPFDRPISRELMVVLVAVFLANAMKIENTRRRIFMGAVAGSVAFLAQLLTVELAVYTVGGAMVVLAIYAILDVLPLHIRKDVPSWRHFAGLLSSFLCVFFVWNILISMYYTLSSPLYGNFFSYQQHSIDIMRGYTLTMGSPWIMSYRLTAALTLIIIMLGAMVAYIARAGRLHDGYLVVSIFVLSLLQLKGTTVRSDMGHIIENSIPMLLLLFILCGSWAISWLWVTRVAWLALIVATLTLWPGPKYAVLHAADAWSAQIPNIPSKLHAIATTRLPQSLLLPEGLPAAVRGLRGPITPFPYEDYIGMELRRDLVTPVLQSYAADTVSLQNLYVQGLEQHRAVKVVYGIDGISSAAVDGVQNIARLPIVFSYLYQHFQLQSPTSYGAGFYVLIRRPALRPIHVAPLPIASRTGSGADIALRLAAPTTCGLTQLSLTLAYPPTVILGRANHVQVQFRLNRTLVAQTNLVPIRTGSPFVTYINAGPPEQFYQAFGPANLQAQAWNVVTLHPQDEGLFGIPPSSATISALGCVHSTAQPAQVAP